MNIDAVISQIRAYCPLFGGNVAGAASYFRAKDEGWLPLPAAYVIPLDDEVGSAEGVDRTDYHQEFSERVGVIVVIDNSGAVAAGDRRGQTAAMQFDAYRWQLFKALLKWRPNSSVDNPSLDPATPGIDRTGSPGLYFIAGAPLEPDLARAFFQFSFALDVQITSDDVWTPDSVPLRQVQIAIDRPAVYGGTDFGDFFDHVLAGEIIALDDGGRI